jgi:hypothetical protein
VGNLKDFTDVNMNIVNNKEFDERIIGDNILELYYNESKESNKLYTKTVTFTQNDFGYIIDTSKLEEVGAFTPKSSDYTYAKSIWFGYENSSWNNRPLNIAEIEVYSGGVNVATKATKTESSSQYSADSYKPTNLIDGNMSNFAHTNNSGTNWFKITLDKQYPIEKVMVYNRTSCCYDRWAESFVKLLNTNGNEIMRSTDTLPSDRSKATNYKEGGVRVKTFTFGNTVATQPTYTKKDNTVLWSSQNLDLDSGYDGKGNGGTLAGTDWKRSRLYPTGSDWLDQCKKKCDSFPKCIAFSQLTGTQWCYLKTSNNLSKTSSNSKYDFYYKS